MPEAILLCLDNSEYMRNGDLPPNRFKAQSYAAGMIARRTVNDNHENAIGVLTMGTIHNNPSVVYPLGRDLSRVYKEIDRIEHCPHTDFTTAMENAILVLKNRPGSNQRQRCIAFIGSPLRLSTEEIVKIGKKLRKHNIGVDVVNIAEPNNTDLLQEFINQVNVDDNSHLITVPSGPHQLSDMITSTPIFGAGGGVPAEEEMDDELRAVLEMSRREAEMAGQVPMEQADSTPSQQESVEGADDRVVLDIVNRIRRGEDVPFDSLTEEQQTQVAILLSTEEEQQQEQQPSDTTPTQEHERSSRSSVNVDDSYLLGETGAMEELLSSVPGVDLSHPDVQQALEEQRKKKEEEDKKEG
ncbi:hypothetical protein P9112_006079 [Eukaryota sp. TZLM1-RC]